jgi:hypothetical protein
MSCLDAGKKESEIGVLDESIEVMRTMSTLKAQWGFSFP